MATLIKPGQKPETVTPADVKRGFTLEETYKLIGGGCDIVQPIRLEDGRTMLIDEESKLRRNDPPLMVNPEATKLLWMAGGMAEDYILGNALIVTRKEFK